MMRLKTSFSFEILFEKIFFIVVMISIFVIFEKEMFFEYSMFEMSLSRVVTNERKKELDKYLNFVFAN
jgi:hypothetical protein